MVKRVFAHIGFSAAITLLALNAVSVRIVPIITSGVAAMFVTSLLLPKYRKNLAVPLCFGSALFSCVVFLTVYYSSVAPAFLLQNSEADVMLYLTDISKRNNSTYVYTARTVKILKDGAPQNLNIRITSDSKLYAEAYQLVSAKLKFYTTGKSAFASYGFWGKGIYLSATVTSYEATDKIVNIPMYYLFNLRQDIIKTLFENVRGDAGALASALITGNKTLLSEKAYTDFKFAGASHLMAVSGLHLSVVTGAFYFVLRVLRVNRKASAVSLIIVTLLFSALTGFPVSVVRAGIMLCTILCGELFKIRADTLNSLGLAVFIICLNPFAVTDSGAVLSVVSVLALITASRLSKSVYARFEKRLAKKKGKSYNISKAVIFTIFESVLVSATVLVFDLPALYVFFGCFSIFSVVLNLVVIPLGSMSAVLSFLTYAANKLSLLESVFNSLDRLLNNIILYMVGLSSHFDFSMLRAGRYFGVVLAVALLLLAIAFLFDNRSFMRFAAVIGIIGITVTSVFNYESEKYAVEVLLLEDGGFAAVSSGEALVYGMKSKYDYYNVSSFLKARRAAIDTLITKERYSKYAIMLSEKYYCNKIISDEFSSEILKSNSYLNYTVSRSIEEKTGSDIYYKFKLQHSNDVCTMKIKDTNFSFNKNTGLKNCIYVESDSVSDYNGVINKKKGAVVYTVYDNNIYEARRLNLWES